MAFASGNAEYKCFLCGTKHKWRKLMCSENPASFKEEDEWPDNVAVFRTAGTTEALSSGGAKEALNVAVETMSLTEADAGSKRGSSGPGRGKSEGLGRKVEEPEGRAVAIAIGDLVVAALRVPLAELNGVFPRKQTAGLNEVPRGLAVACLP